MDKRFNGYCPGCVNKDLCFNKEVCLRLCLSNEYDDDDNVSEGSEVEQRISELTEKSKYSTYENRIDPR